MEQPAGRISGFGNGFVVLFKVRSEPAYTFWTKAPDEAAAVADGLAQLKQRTGKAAWTTEAIEPRSIEVVPIAPSILLNYPQPNSVPFLT